MHRHPQLIQTFLVLAISVLSACQSDTSTELAWQPPAFQAPTANGEVFAFPGQLERPTIILFWATWCPYCKALMPHLQSIMLEHPGKVDVLALNIRDDGDPVAYFAEYGFDFQLILEADQIAENWGVKGTPGLFLANTEGLIVYDRMRLPPPSLPEGADATSLKHYQKASISAPYWAARLRAALDDLL